LMRLSRLMRGCLIPDAKRREIPIYCWLHRGGRLNGGSHIGSD
jgi:hypothetical protein